MQPMKTARQYLLLLPALIAGVALLPAGRVRAQNFSTLHSFSATDPLFLTNSDGAVPQSRLILSGDTLYGVTSAGGSTSNGTIFAIRTNGAGFRTVYNFTNGSDGAVPAPGPLVLLGSNLYGTTVNGGSVGGGTIFSVNTNGSNFSTIYNFTGNGSGIAPTGGLILAGNTFFGTTSAGGAIGSTAGGGTIYSVLTNGTSFKVLSTFTNTGSNGYNPNAGLVLSGATLYGVAQAGPTAQSPVNGGTVFALLTNGAGFKVLHAFAQPSGGTNTDGISPQSSLFLSGGTLYGTTYQGGTNGYGNIFAINTDGSNFRILYSFQNAADGSGPYGGVILSGGTMYGTAALGGNAGGGSAFALNSDGTGFTLLHDFSGGSDGGGPFGGLMLSGNSLYGTADDGGALSTNGTVFALRAPFVQFTASPTFGVTPVTVNFASPAADNYGNAITSWTWNFGDGTTGAGQNPSHTYTNAGTFSPVIQVVNNNGLLISGSGPSIITYAPTTIGFTASPTNGTAPLTVNFVSPAVDSATNAITSWNWTFGDGTTGSGQNPTHTYMGAGQYSPVLNATNINAVPVFPSGQSAVIVVFGATIEFTANPTTGAVPLTVNFSSPAVDNEGHAIVSWYWTFGDGTSGAGQNPTHIYSSAGSFVPALTATNSLGTPVSGFGPAFITATNLPVSSGLVLNGGFATGNFTGWTLSGSPSNALNIFVDNGSQSELTPYSGNYVAALGSVGSLSYLSQTLPTAAGAPYLISLWLDSPDGLTPNQFLVSWNGTNLFNQTNIPAIGWTNLQFLVTATGPATTLQFGFRDDPSYLGLDGVTVVQPAISGVNSSGTNLVLNGVNGLSGLTNYVLMGTNILEPLTNWTRVATNVVGTNGSFTNTISKPVIPGAGQRYYIIQFGQ
jgi:uncharacterized repeat protein (TIGR03803 family)